MLIYEKENKLNINFENSVNETPDLQIGKDGDKTQILVDGQESGGGGGLNILRLYLNIPTSNIAYLDPALSTKFNSYDEAKQAIESADLVILKPVSEEDHEGVNNSIPALSINSSSSSIHAEIWPWYETGPEIVIFDTSWGN